MSNLPACRGRSFCRSSNSPLGSVLVMFLSLCFSYSTDKTNFANEPKLPVAFPPTFVLPVAEIVIPMCHKMVWLALFTEQYLGQPIITHRGVIGVGKTSQSLAQQELTSACLTVETLLNLSAQWPASLKGT